MRIGIVPKLFLLTAALCTLILAAIYIGQTIFFKDYYANRKVNDLKTKLEVFKKAYQESAGNAHAIQSLEQEFYRNNNTSITILDHDGNLKYENDFYLEFKLLKPTSEEEEKLRYQVPLYHLISMDDAAANDLSTLRQAGLFFTGIKSSTAFTPISLHRQSGEILYSNQAFMRQAFDGDRLKYQGKPKLQSDKWPIIELFGTVTDVHLPKEGNASELIYSNKLFLEQVNAFQAKLLFSDFQPTNSLLIQDYEQNNVKYKLFTLPVQSDSGSINYLFAMTSLQPVDEAVQMVKDYYVYIVLFVFVLILIASLYYSLQLARPLLRINQTTQKMANLDFSESIPVRAKDEIGDLSSNINQLSAKLHTYISKLQEDIEKEKQLESTRKEFISGVSHELKTPLSVMKSCISILKDGVAAHKKEHYFAAMEQEVDRMDLLIVDMLELAKYESGTYNMPMDTFRLDKAIEHICSGLMHELGAKQLRLRLQLAMAEACANQHRIEQVITNFMTNAIRYTPEQHEIIVTETEKGERIIVCVENKGAHIPEDQIAKVWDRFYRGDRSRQRADGGTGLGLAISKNILELHGAEYGAYNTEDGVAFYFCLNKGR
ncbi:signal transduction histidine kinase [Paenibacillus taihuensis]|uniref:histidine kinase n=1 Tax=Paenibacillus taihuensis TaxID=1156355 RepID=A0A3D9S7B2_9BACL|nr:HAMP domain-containing sensor histidine kinase [Paenibacillus taihuensis]REE88914.1 signal transduction histidine kinase [Paenibacillus taihuensis]